MRIQAKRLPLLAVLVLALAVPTVVLAASGYSLFGDATLVTPGNASPTAVQLRSDATPGWGGVDFDIAAGTTFATLTELGTDYNVTDDDCVGGSPRFQINVDTGSGIKNIFAYIGPYPNYTNCLTGWQNSGDLLDGTQFLDTSQLGGTFYDPYANALLLYGSYPVVGIQLVVDSGWAFTDGEQTILVDNVMINNTTYTFEGVNSCKKDGWQQFISAPGPFKNQGACVSYFSHNK